MDPDVSFLSFSLPSLKNTGTSPFQQELESTGYVELRGTCDRSVTEFQFQLDNNGWKPIPSSPGIAPPGVDLPSTPYDVDCSDGTFFIYLLKDQIEAFLPAGATLEDYSPSAVHLRGTGGPFATDPLSFYAEREGDGGAPEANAFVLRALSDRLGINLCAPVDIWLVHMESGSSSWSGWVSNPREREVALSLMDFTAGGVQFYWDESCETGIVSDVKIPAGATSKKIYVKGTTDTEGYISGQDIGNLQKAEPPQFLTFGTPGSVAKVRFQDTSRRPAVGRCQDVLVLLTDENDLLAGPTAEMTAQVATSAEVTVYDGAGCVGSGSSVEQVVFPAGGKPWRTLSYRVSDPSSKFLSLDMGTGGPLAYHYINPWTAAHQALLKQAVLVPGLPYQAPDCAETKVHLVGREGGPQNDMGAGYTFDYQVGSYDYDVIFYDDPSCATGASPGSRVVTFNPGETERSVYWKLGPLAGVSTVVLNGRELISQNSPPRLEEGIPVSLEVPVVTNLSELGAAMGSVWRLPRMFLPAPLAIDEIPRVAELSNLGGGLTLFKDIAGNGAEAAYFDAGGGRIIGQQVLNLKGGEGLAAVSESREISLGSAYTVAIMFRTEESSRRTLMGFTGQTMDLYEIQDGTIQVMGCSIGTGLSDGRWHTLIVSRPPLSLGDSQIVYKLDEAAPQACALNGGLLAGLTDAFQGAFGIGWAGSGPGFIGQVVEVLYDADHSVSSPTDPIFGRLSQHFLNRYPKE